MLSLFSVMECTASKSVAKRSGDEDAPATITDACCGREDDDEDDDDDDDEEEDDEGKVPLIVWKWASVKSHRFLSIHAAIMRRTLGGRIARHWIEMRSPYSWWR